MLLQEKLERFTSATVTDRRRLEQELEEVRREGYSMCVGELEETLYGASAPVLNERERPVAIVSVWGPQHRLPAERLPDIGRMAKAAAGEIKALLA